MKIAVSLLLLASMALATTTYADPPDGKGGGNKNRDADWRDGKGKGKGSDARSPDRSDHANGRDNETAHARQPGSPGGAIRHFEERQRSVVREFYTTEYRSGRCPPGLAKKNNGCMPPGQAKKWRIGHPLPREVIYYDLPSTLVVSIGMPPAGYRYVRVASDILLIAIGTGMVVDAIADLGGM